MDQYVQWRFYENFPSIHRIHFETGISYQRLAELTGRTTMTLWRWSKGAVVPLEKRVLLMEIYEKYRRKNDR